jgi:hypothetical protein
MEFSIPFFSNNIKPTVKWERKTFEISRENDMFFDFTSVPYHGTLVSSLLQKRTRENEMAVLWNEMYEFGILMKEWLWKQIRYTGFLNWSQPWFVIRHRYFYRGY